ncbi:MAG: hypothetical protein IKM08_01240 [Clostridia bacterium]|nr:hypothetical protein [Clostridia bacterium]
MFKRMLTALLFVLGLTVLLTVSAAAESGTATFYKGDSVYTTGTADVSGELILPDCSSDKVFLGWCLESTDGNRLYPAGVSVTLTGDETVFRAVEIDLRTLTGAAVSMGSPTTLRFDGALSVADHASLSALVGADNIALGILIAPATEVYGAEQDSTKFQKGCDADGLLDRAAATFDYTTATCHVFSGRTAPIADDMLLESFAARAYLTVTTPDFTITVYADYDPEKHDRMAHFVTAKAFEDRTDHREGGHIYQTEAFPDHYARYPEGLLAQLEDRLDKVVSVSQWQLNSATNQTEARVVSEYAKDIYGGFIAFEFYTSPYRVERVMEDSPVGYDTYVVVAEDGADFNHIKVYYIGHSFRPPSADEWKADGLYISVRNNTGLPF